LEVQVVEIPRHVYVRLFIDQRRIEVESTSRTGFDLRPKPVLGPETLPDPGYGANAGGVGVPLAALVPAPEGVDLERAVGFLWHNSGRRALEQGEALRAARCFLEEARREPLEASQSETLGMLLARAFRLEYEAGNFDDAYRIAEIGAQIFPGQTTARDRLLAASLKRIEATCDAGRIVEAEEILDRTGSAAGNPVDVRRLERGACPLIAAAAVRLEDWERAARMARRFAVAERDGVESERLTRWVVRRERDARGVEEPNACIEAPALFSEDRPSPLFPDSRAGVPPASSPAAPGQAAE